jgi:large subunit ribosomal protein L4
MAKVDVYNLDGAVTGQIELSDDIFGIEPNEFAIQAVIRNQLANRRQGTQSTKTRSEVSGGGKRPYRQKGTGRARHGSTRSAQYVGGGVIFGRSRETSATRYPRR